MLRTRVRKRSQRTRATGLMMLFTINGQKSSPKKRTIAAIRRERTTRLEIFISAHSPGITTIYHDGFQTLDCQLLIDRVGLPVAVAHGLKKPGQLMNGLVRDSSRLQ